MRTFLIIEQSPIVQASVTRLNMTVYAAFDFVSTKPPMQTAGKQIRAARSIA
jgi:hypothetical protein